DAQGWLIGEENSGLKLMFVMMNEERLGVGVQGLAQADAAYQAAVSFAKERLQGRSLSGPKNPDSPADPIIVHPDVRRMLLDAKAFLEGGRAFLYWTPLHGDLMHCSPDAAVREKASDYMGLLTPVAKAFCTDRGFRVCSDAMQVHGGSGFTEHFPVSQYLRDVRISMIYEGANGVQALDLVGRKLAANGGRALQAFFAEIDAYVAEPADAALAPFVEGLKGVKGQLQEATVWLMQNGLQNPEAAGAASTDYLHLFGLTCLAYMWAKIAKVAQAKIAAGDTDRLYPDKLKTGRYFLGRVLPDAAAHLAKLKTGAEPVMSLDVEGF
ncbi:MAG TPA: acyl-CoA dehydrogenase C-terminal domain-containing protein, partial [Caulobacteraceae bacterium]|nr:acyl-CoA dehydrogenase C-terminal domain-containing protein [Caulobacteraceae bacterium]